MPTTFTLQHLSLKKKSVCIFSKKKCCHKKCLPKKKIADSKNIFNDLNKLGEKKPKK